MTVSAGELRHRVLLQTKVQERNPSNGAFSYSWSEGIPLWAAINPLSVREFVAASSTQSKVTTRIKIRYREGVDSTARFVHGEKIYNIEGALADPDSGLEYLTLACYEGTNDGG